MRRRGLRVVLFVGLIVLAFVALRGGFTAAPRSPLAGRVLGRDDFKGHTPGSQHSYNTPSAWAVASFPAVTRNADIARLTREGFKSALTELLSDAHDPQASPDTGLSWVMELGSAGSARAELAAYVRFFRGFSRFPVETIPGAIEFLGRHGVNVAFADGPFVYLEGSGWNGKAHDPTHSALIAAATKLYLRVHGHPA
jgi:hypothetical protein